MYVWIDLTCGCSKRQSVAKLEMLSDLSIFVKSVKEFLGSLIYFLYSTNHLEIWSKNLVFIFSPIIGTSHVKDCG